MLLIGFNKDLCSENNIQMMYFFAKKIGRLKYKKINLSNNDSQETLTKHKSFSYLC